MKKKKWGNPPYDPGHCFTVVRCEKCGEYYEPDKEHVCRKKNSWRFIVTEEDLAGLKKECR